MQAACRSSDLDQIEIRAQFRPRNVRHMAMMGEEHALRRASHIRQDPQPMGGAGVVETGEKIVGDEGRRLGPTGVILHIGEAQGEIELIARALAEAPDGDLLAAGALAMQRLGVVLAVGLADARKSPAGEGGLRG